MAAFTEQHNVVTEGRTVSANIPHTGAGEISWSSSVAGSNGTATWTTGFDKDVPVFIYLKSTQDVTVVFKDGSAQAVKTITLVANVPWTWRVGDSVFSADVASIVVTNAGATAATVDIEILLDSGTT